VTVPAGGAAAWYSRRVIEGEWICDDAEARFRPLEGE
jgi:hypothetical protein